MRKQLVLLFVMVLILLSVTNLCTAAYKIIDLGTLGGDDSAATYISNNGSIVGYSRTTRIGYKYAALFDTSSSGNNKNLGVLSGCSSSTANCVNNTGQAVGESQEGGGTYDYHAVLFDTIGNSQPKYLGTIGGPRGKAQSINDKGKIVGFSYPGDPGSTNPHATLFDESGAGHNVDLGMVPGGRRSIAYSINDSNQIVGFVDMYGDAAKAVLFDETGDQNNISLGYGIACSVNNHGQVVGESSGGIATIFDITGAGNNVSLGALPVYDSSKANCISDSGQIVGEAYYWYDSYKFSRAVFFDESGTGNNIDLNYLIEPASGWELLEATGINEEGWIVGNGKNSDGEYHAFLLIPEPPKYGGGSGTPEDPYQIHDANHMQAIGADSNDWDKCFKLMTDIDLDIYTGTEFNIIGYYITRPLHEPIEVPFSGVFDGNDNVIYSFTYSSNERDNVGLFGFVDDANAEIRNLTLITPDVNAATKSDVGSLIGVLNAGHVLNCKVEGGSIYGSGNVGGLVGAVTSPSGRITNCYSSAMVSGDDNIGGFVGRNTANITPGKGGKITNCFASGVVSGDSSIGGLVGLNCWLISDCYATGNISGISNTGGLVGDNCVGTISKSYAKGNVKGHDKTGGIVGWNTGGTISNCYAVGEVDGINDTGGMIGRNVSGMLLFNMVSNCYAGGDVSGISNTGGLVGFGSSVVSYTSCFWDSDVNPDVNGMGNTTDPNVVGKTTDEMMTESTFANAGWDFINVWGIGENQTYPYLRTYLAGDINKDGIVNFRDFAFIALQWLEEYNMGNRRPEVVITYPEDGDRLMVGGIPPQTMILVEAEDYDGTVVLVEFFDGEMKLGEDTGGIDGWNFLWQYYSLGWHTLTAVAWDEEGLSGTSAPVTVEVWMPDPPPP